MPLFPRDGEAIVAPSRLPVLPLRDTVLFPYVVTPIVVGRAASLAAIEAAAAADGMLFVVAQRDTTVDDPSAADLHRIGVVARIQQASRLANGTVRVLLEGAARARVSRYGGGPAAMRATVVPFPLVEPAPAHAAPADAPTDAGTAERQATTRQLLSLFEDYAALQRRVPGEIVALLRDVASPERQAFGVAAHLLVRPELRQHLLEAADLPAMLARLAEVIAGELDLLGLERQIEERVRGAIFQNQREFYLNEQLKAIHRELGQDETDDVTALEAQVRAKQLPPAVEARALREVRRLRRMPLVSPEATVSRTFLDWVLGLAWPARTAPAASDAPAVDPTAAVARARAVLDEDHYGLDEVKERILDYIAVLTLVGEVRGPVLCLVGPPGVGKTSLGRSIARALGRRFARLSLGGVRDEAEIRGHRRTYIGAMPGRIIQAMRRAEAVDPVLLLDEIDKTGSDWRGDPAAALLEVLDPEQHHAFSDHFLEIEYDLSRVLFVTTANSLAGIPEPLRDRMEIIRIPGYLEPEKLAIARRYLVPRALRASGLDPEAVTWDDDALATIVRGWTREAGVRDLERRIARVARKLARRRASGDAPSERGLHVRTTELSELLGPPPFLDDDRTSDDKIGVANGLAYTPAGGELLEVEVSVVPGRGRLQLTGALGDVMKESASAALSYVRARTAVLGIDPDFHKTRDLHIHIPAGATPKDGPSAGITIATALVSALTGVPVRADVAMTGEITLRGRVLAVGGVKEKAVAAHRHRVLNVVLPRANEREALELPAEVRDAMQWHPVASMDEVLVYAQRRPPAEAAPEVPNVPTRRPAPRRRRRTEVEPT